MRVKMVRIAIALLGSLVATVVFAQTEAAKPDPQDKLRQAIEENTRVIGSLKGAVDGLKSSVDRIPDIRGAVEDLKNAIKAIPDLKDSIDGLKVSVDGLGGIKTSIDNAKGAIDALTGAAKDAALNKPAVLVDIGSPFTNVFTAPCNNNAECDGVAVTWCKARGYKYGTATATATSATGKLTLSSFVCHDTKQ